MILLLIRFAIYFSISFFLLCLPVNHQPIFFYVYDFGAEAMFRVTGIDKYVPNYKIDKAVLQESAVKKTTH